MYRDNCRFDILVSNLWFFSYYNIRFSRKILCSFLLLSFVLLRSFGSCIRSQIVFEFKASQFEYRIKYYIFVISSTQLAPLFNKSRIGIIVLQGMENLVN